MLSVESVTRRAKSFPVAIGMGWDKWKPRAISGCDDLCLVALIWIFILAELLGQRPRLIGCIVFCLLGKAGGGQRPIGLLPTLIRWWMRVRLDVACAWPVAHNRPFLNFYAGPSRDASVAAWKQAARAELASYAQWSEYLAALFDFVKAFERVPHD